jgi:hypothetical protein
LDFGKPLRGMALAQGRAVQCARIGEPIVMDDLTKCPPPTDYTALEIHPIAEEIEEASKAEYQALRESIRKTGIQVPIRLYEGKILDGRHRYRAGRELGYAFKPSDFRTFYGTAAEAKKLSEDLNLARRHLSIDQRAEKARGLLKENAALSDPLSNREIARRCSLSHVKVGQLRKEFEATADVAVAEDRVLEKFIRDWSNLTEDQQEGFVVRLKVELRDFLEDVEIISTR